MPSKQILPRLGAQDHMTGYELRKRLRSLGVGLDFILHNNELTHGGLGSVIRVRTTEHICSMPLRVVYKYHQPDYEMQPGLPHRSAFGLAEILYRRNILDKRGAMSLYK